MSLPWSWGATDEELLSARQTAMGTILIRAVSVDAPAPIVFRWLCQLKVAPYSYDLLDNRGRRSPRTLTPGAEVLTIGEPVARIFALEDFAPNESLTLRMSDPGALRLFGPMTMTYRVSEAPNCQPNGAHGSNAARLIGVLDVLDGEGALSPLRRRALAWGDLVMMRKQLLVLRDLSQESSREAARRAAG